MSVFKREEKGERRFSSFVVLYYLNVSYGFWNNISCCRYSFYPMIRPSIFQQFPLNLLRSKITNKSVLDSLKGFSFRALSGDFTLEQSFSSVPWELLINLHTTGCRTNEYIHGAWCMACYLEESKM